MNFFPPSLGQWFEISSSTNVLNTSVCTVPCSNLYVRLHSDWALSGRLTFKGKIVFLLLSIFVNTYEKLVIVVDLLNKNLSSFLNCGY